MIRAFFLMFALGCLLVGVLSTLMLLKIHGTSDGPGALLFYIGAFFGYFFAGTTLWALLTTKSP